MNYRFSINRLLLVISISIFIVEILIMILIKCFLSELNLFAEILLDSGLLITCLIPIFYFFIYSPMRQSIDLLIKSEEKISKSEKLLQIKNSEYIALNEEYASQNEEIKSQNEEYLALNDEFQKKNEELIIAKSNAEDSEKLKSAFLANMSHEIRTPLNSIIGFSNLLNRPNLKEEKRVSYINIIISSGNHLLNLINDIIDISKIQSKQLAIYTTEIRINPLLEELFTSFSQLDIENKEIEIILNKGLSDNEDIICTDETRLKQILTNLISNALKFTDSGKIEISYKVNENVVLFSVSDTGIGMTNEDAKIIFDKFRQVGYDIKRKYGGAGLGLTISKALVELLGGDIWVESEKGKGSIFSFTIPYKTAEQCKQTDSETKVNVNNQKFIGKTILITEDDTSNIKYFNELLEDSMANILIAKTGTEAITFVKENKNIDIVLMDIQLPDMTGYETTKRIKEIRKDLPVIAQTANAMHDDKQKALNAGCDAYISKPINSEMLYSLINKLLG